MPLFLKFQMKIAIDWCIFHFQILIQTIAVRLLFLMIQHAKTTTVILKQSQKL